MGADVIEQGIEVFLSCEAAYLFLIAFVNDDQIGYRAVNFPLFIKAFGNGKAFINTLYLTNGNIAAAVQAELADIKGLFAETAILVFVDCFFVSFELHFAQGS